MEGLERLGRQDPTNRRYKQGTVALSVAERTRQPRQPRQVGRSFGTQRMCRIIGAAQVSLRTCGIHHLAVQAVLGLVVLLLLSVTRHHPLEVALLR